MKHWLGHNLLAILLAVFVSAGLSLSAVQSNNMAIKMSVSFDMDTMSPDGCEGCAGGGDNGAMGCSASCSVTAFATLPAPVGVESRELPGWFAFFRSTPRDGPVSTDPNPPKSHKFS